MPKISIIIPVYNTEQYLRCCVDSVLAQTFTDFECILIDDGSPDNCPAICDEYAEKDCRIRVIHQENQGQAAARNAGIDWTFSNSNSQWISFVDSDDWVHPKYLECLFHNAIKFDVKISMCHRVEVKSNQKTYTDYCCLDGVQRYATEEELEYQCYGDGFGGFVTGYLIAKELLKQNRFTKGKIFEDSAITCQWLYVARTFSECSLPLYYYYVNCEGTLRGKFSMKQLDVLWSKDEQEVFYEKIGYSHMQLVVAKSYILSAARCYRGLLSQLHEKRQARCVMHLLKKKYLRYRKQMQFSPEERDYVFQMLFPRVMDVFWMMKGQWEKLKIRGK